MVFFFGVFFVLSGFYLVVGQVVNIVGVIFVVLVSNCIGKKNIYMGVMSLVIFFFVIFYWFGKGDIILIFVFQVLISICVGSIFFLFWFMYVDCVDYLELKIGNWVIGLIFLFLFMSQKFGWVIGSVLIGWLLVYFGFCVNEVQSVEVIYGIKMFFSWLFVVGIVLFVVFISMYLLLEKKMREVILELEKRRKVI